MKSKILVSACLLGTPCRYDGASKPCEEVIRLRENFELIPFCPEEAGGLCTPRMPCEIVGDRVIRRDGTDLTDAYRKGAEQALKAAKKENIAFAVLKERSPSCGKNFRYDGTFSGAIIPKPGITCELFLNNSIEVYSEEEMKNGR